MSRLKRIFQTYFKDRATPKPMKGLKADGTADTLTKTVQYLMLLFLFGLAFFLPGYGLKKQAEEQAAGRIVQHGSEQMELQTEQESTSYHAGESQGTIVLDAGHGGFDPGMVGLSGINEKVLNLVYAKKLEALLTQEGYRVVMTRATEDGLYDESESNKKAQDMQRRCAVIEEEKPLLTVSIHQNSYSDPSVCGPQVFYYEHSTEGERLAAAIQTCMNEQLEIERPRVQKGNASYYILKRSGSVTVIVECGFLSNPQEEQKLQEEAYQERVARAICDGILQYLNGEEAAQQ